MARIVVIGLGPAGPELVAPDALDALDRMPARFARTSRHPAATVVEWSATFDAVYERGATLDTVYEEIVDRLVAAANEHREVVYAVPGSPLIAERTVELLRVRAARDGDLQLDVGPALSFLDLAWARLGVDPMAAGVRVVDGHRFAVEAAGERGPLLVGQCDSAAVLSDIKLAFGDAPPASVTVLQRLGSGDEAVFDVAGTDLDLEPDHRTALWIPELGAPVGAELVRFAELVRTLRERCPWDREQTHLSLTHHLLEESYEVLEAIAALDQPEPGAGYPHLEEELGDLLFQVVFHATLGAEAGEFTLADVARGIHDKLVRRHPHVFGDVDADSAAQVVAKWEQIKKAETGRASVFDGIPGELPALLYAHKVLRKAESIGVGYESEDSDGSEGSEGDDVGERLLALVAEARRAGVDPETALRAATARFRDRAKTAE